MCQWDAVVFDLDDTLYPERDFVKSGIRAVAGWAQEALGVPAQRAFEEMFSLFEQGVRGRVFDAWLESRGMSPRRYVPALVEVYRSHTPRIRPYEGVVELLAALNERYRLGLVSDGLLDVQRRKLHALGLAASFQAVVFSDELGRDAWKPSPRPFRLVLSQLGTASARAVYVGDNPAKDFRGPRALGMKSIRLRHPEGVHARAEPTGPAHAPTLEVHSLTELRKLLIADARWSLRSRPTTSGSSN